MPIVDIGDLDQRARNLRREAHDMRIDESVVGRFILPRMQPVEQRTHRDRGDDDDQNDPEQRLLEQRRLLLAVTVAVAVFFLARVPGVAAVGVFVALAIVVVIVILVGGTVAVVAHCGSCRSAISRSRMASVLAATRARTSAISSGESTGRSNSRAHVARAARIASTWPNRVTTAIRATPGSRRPVAMHTSSTSSAIDRPIGPA